jgi:hypothetical protein
MNFQRLKGTRINVDVSLISIVVLFVALFVVMGLANAQKPVTMHITPRRRTLAWVMF